MDANYLTTEQVAAELGVTARRVLALIKAGRLKSKAVGIAPRITHLIARADLAAVRDRKAGRPKKAEPVKAAKPKRKKGSA